MTLTGLAVVLFGLFVFRISFCTAGQTGDTCWLRELLFHPDPGTHTCYNVKRFSPGERLELREVGPARSLGLPVLPRVPPAVYRCLPPGSARGRAGPSGIPEVCRPARIRGVLLGVVAVVRLGPVVPLLAAVLHAASRATLRSLRDPEPGRRVVSLNKLDGF